LRPTAVAAVPHGHSDLLLTVYDGASSTCWVLDLDMAWRIADAIADAADEVGMRLARAAEAPQALNAPAAPLPAPAPFPAPAQPAAELPAVLTPAAGPRRPLGGVTTGPPTINAKFYR
jgi:hypothetical protein